MHEIQTLKNEKRRPAEKIHPAIFLIFLAILAVAAFLRAGQPGMVDMVTDNTVMLSMAHDASRGLALPLHGTSTGAGLLHFPLSIYLYALPLIVWESPYSLVFFAAFLNTLAVVLCGWFAYRQWGIVAALCSTLLFATSPWAVLLSRKMSESNLLPFLTMIYLISGTYAFSGKKNRDALIVHLSFLALSIMLHFSAVALVPVTGCLLLRHWKSIDFRLLLMVSSILLLLASAFLLHAYRYSGESINLVELFPSSMVHGEPGANKPGADEPGLTASLLDQFKAWWEITNGKSDGLRLFIGSSTQPGSIFPPEIPLIEWTIALLAIGGIVLGFRNGFVKNGNISDTAAGIVALWAVSPVFFLWIGRVSGLFSPCLHYYYVAFPAQFLAAGYFVTRMTGKIKTLRWASICISIEIAAAQCIAVLMLLNLAASESNPAGFPTPIEFGLKAAKKARDPGSPVTIVQFLGEKSHDWGVIFDLALADVPLTYLSNIEKIASLPLPATLVIVPGCDASMDHLVNPILIAALRHKTCNPL